MNRDDIVAFLNRRQDAWQRRDAAALAADYADDAVVESPWAGTVTGRDAIEGSFRALFAAFPDLEMAEEDLVIDDGRVAMAVKVTGTHQGEFLGVGPTGKRFEFRLVWLMTIRDNHIVRDRRIYDFAGFLLKIGVLKAKPV